MKVNYYGLKQFCFYVLLLLFFLGGCATVKPPALSTTDTVDVSKESVALLTVKIANQYKQSYQPNITFVLVWGDKKYSFKVDGKYKGVEKTFNEYLISFQLPPGNYKLRELWAEGSKFPIYGTFVVPMYSSFSIEPNKIIYLGHIEATVKERTDDKLLRAGPVIPLIDQSTVGASGGTFVISIKDLFKDDMKLFQQKYPYLTRHKVDNRTLPQWTQPIE